MGNLLAIWNLSTKTIDREKFVIIVIFKYLKACIKSLSILILPTLVQIMQWSWILRISITKRKINSNMNVNFTATKYVIQEGNSILTFELINPHLAAWDIKGSRVSTIDQITECYFIVAELFVISTATWIKFENLEQNWLLIISLTQSVCIQNNFIPSYTTIKNRFRLWF